MLDSIWQCHTHTSGLNRSFCHCQPTNILVNKNLELKICDLGFARTTAPLGPHDVNLSREAVTQYWRAPEVELSVGGYTQALGKLSIHVAGHPCGQYRRKQQSSLSV